MIGVRAAPLDMGAPLLLAGQNVALAGFGRWDRLCTVTRARHRLTRGGLITSVEMKAGLSHKAIHEASIAVAVISSTSRAARFLADGPAVGRLLIKLGEASAEMR